jgi:hypothetical protein
MSSKNDVVYQVVARPSGRRGKLALLALVSVFSVFALGLVVGQWNANVVILKSIELTSINSALESEKASLQSRLEGSDLLVEVNETAIAQLRNRLDEVLLEKSDLEYAVTFYRNLIKDSAGKGPVEMFEFKAFATEAEDVYEFSILLGQDVQAAKTISGEVELSIIGASADRDPIEFTTENSIMGFPLTYKFKYFQDLAGKIRLPIDFQPKRAAIVVRSTGGRSLVERELDWRLDS